MIAGHLYMTIYQNSKHLNVVSTQKNGDHGTRIKLECRPILMLDSHVVVDTDYLLAVPNSTICLVPFWVTQVSQNSTRQMVLCRTARRQSVFTSKCESSIKLDLDCLNWIWSFSSACVPHSHQLFGQEKSRQPRGRESWSTSRNLLYL